MKSIYLSCLPYKRRKVFICLVYPINAEKILIDKHTASFFPLSVTKRFTNLQKQEQQKTFSPVCMLLVVHVKTERHVSYVSLLLL